MLTWILIAVFLIVAGFNWWVGTWNATINLINFFIATLVACSYFENLAALIDSFNGTYRMLSDFVAIWLLFVLTFVLLRTATDLLTKFQLRMNFWVDHVARVLLALWVAGGFACFSSFTLHLAPLPPHLFEYSPNQKNFGVGPDQMWMAFVQSRSRGALAQSKEGLFLPEYTLADHPDDVKLESRVFDPRATFGYRGWQRRMLISENPELRVPE